MRNRFHAIYFFTYPILAVTGSSQGMGRAILDAVLASGQRVVATLQRPDVLAEYPEKYSPYQLLITRLDVSDPVRIIEVFKEVKEHFGRLGIVVNNTGYGIASEIETTPEDEARKLFEVNFWGLVNISKQVGRHYAPKLLSKVNRWFCSLGSEIYERYQPTGSGWPNSQHELHGGLQRQPNNRLLLCNKIRLMTSPSSKTTTDISIT